MPLVSHQIPGGARVVLRFCDGCNAPNAPFGTGSLHEAIRTKDPSKVKVWCGPTGCKAQVAETDERAA